MGRPRARALLLLDLTSCNLLRVSRGAVDRVSMERFIDGELDYFRSRERPVFHVVTADDGSSGEPADAIDQVAGLIASRFMPRVGEIVLVKSADSAFFDTSLGDQLDAFGVRKLTIVGLETHTSVLASAIDGCARDLQVVVPDTCVGAAVSELHVAALNIIQASPWRRGSAGGDDRPEKGSQLEPGASQ